MTKRTGKPRGAVPVPDDSNLDRMAELYVDGNHLEFEFDTDTKTGGEITRNLAGASRQVAREHGNDDRHDGYFRKRVSRKYQKELKNAPMAGGPDEQNVPFYPREEAALSRRLQKRRLFASPPKKPKT